MKSLDDLLKNSQLDANLVGQISQHVEQIKHELKQSSGEIAKLNQEIRHKDTTIHALNVELAYYRRLRYQSKAERFSPEQRDLFNETLDEDMAAIEAEPVAQEELVIKVQRKKPTGRHSFPDTLPRIDHYHEPESCQCGKCGHDLVKIGEDISEKLDIEPARFIVHRHRRPKYACRTCDTIIAAPLPNEIIDGGIPTARLLAWVAIQKFVDHLPLHRVEGIADRLGFKIPSSTAASWMGQLGVALQPLYDRLHEYLLKRAVLHADETPVPLLDPGQGKTHQAYLWAFRTTSLDTGPPIVLFEFHKKRSGHNADEFLKNWTGLLMVDDYVGYKKLFTSGRGIVELACMAHARRKFFELYNANKHPDAEKALKFIRKLYEIEAEAAEFTFEQRQAHRAHYAKPLLNDFQVWLQAQVNKAAPNSPLAKALNYSLKRWASFCRYAEDGISPIDNNAVENAIRPIAIGKKNWLFAGSERAGKRAATIQSLLATAKANGLDPNVWLIETLTRLPSHKAVDIDELLPLRKHNSML